MSDTSIVQVVSPALNKRVSKRALEEDNQSQDGDERGTKRLCLTDQPGTTESVYRAMVQTRDLNMPQDQFVGLCAYLCTILQWGYSISTCQLDSFITTYPRYTAALSELEARRMADITFHVPSYHKWFSSRSEDVYTTEVQVLSEATLRAIWREHPYTFLRTHWSLKMIAKRAQESQLQQPQNQLTAIPDDGLAGEGEHRIERH